MISTPPASHILLATSVITRIEAALAELWALTGQDLRQKIDSLRQHGVQGHVIGALHYLRIERNHVLHHPCRPLRDVERFRTLANMVLPVIERQLQGAVPPVRLSEQLKGMVSDRMASLANGACPPAAANQGLTLLIARTVDRLKEAHFEKPYFDRV